MWRFGRLTRPGVNDSARIPFERRIDECGQHRFQIKPLSSNTPLVHALVKPKFERYRLAMVLKFSDRTYAELHRLRTLKCIQPFLKVAGNPDLQSSAICYGIGEPSLELRC